MSPQRSSYFMFIFVAGGTEPPVLTGYNWIREITKSEDVVMVHQLSLRASGDNIYWL